MKLFAMKYFLSPITIFALSINISFSQELPPPEKYYLELTKKIFSLTFNNKDPLLFMKYISNSCPGHEEIESKLNLELKKYDNIKFILKNFEIGRLDSSKSKVTFEWTKTSRKKGENTIEYLPGKSIYVFKNDIIIRMGGDSIFANSDATKQIYKNPGVLKGGTINLVPDESFEFSTENLYQDNTLKGDIGIKKDGNTLLFHVAGGVIQDMGIIQISEIEEAPEAGYSESVPVAIGHSYCLRDNNNRYAKLQVTYIEGSETGQTPAVVSLNWIYQEKESRVLKP